jgi:hypothetical protein
MWLFALSCPARPLFCIYSTAIKLLSQLCRVSVSPRSLREFFVLLIGDRKQEFSRWRQEIMFGKDYRAFPYLWLVGLLPLAEEDRYPGKMRRLVKLDTVDYGLHIRFADGFKNGIGIKGAGPLNGINQNLNNLIAKPHGDVEWPFLLLLPSFKEAHGGGITDGGIGLHCRTPEGFRTDAVGQVTPPRFDIGVVQCRPSRRNDLGLESQCMGLSP